MTVQNLNLMQATVVKPGNHSQDLTTTLTTTVLGPVPAGKLWMLLAMYVPNIDGAAVVDTTFSWYQADGGVSPRNKEFSHTIPVPNDASIVYVDKTSPLLLLEGDEIRGGASAAGDAVVHFSFLELAV